MSKFVTSCDDMINCNKCVEKCDKFPSGDWCKEVIRGYSNEELRKLENRVKRNRKKRLFIREERKDRNEVKE